MELNKEEVVKDEIEALKYLESTLENFLDKISFSINMKLKSELW